MRTLNGYDTKYFYLLVFSVSGLLAKAQYYQLYFDYGHESAYFVNQAARFTAEATLNNRTKAILDNQNKINDNLNRVVLIKDMVYHYLTEVNEALKDGRQIKYIIRLVDDIVELSNAAVNDVKDNPEYAVFTRKAVNNIRTQGLYLFSDLTNVINKGGVDVMMDNSTRGELIADVVRRLRLMRAGLYMIRNNIKWAKREGFWNKVNPFRTWINKDKIIINRIIADYKHVTR